MKTANTLEDTKRMKAGLREVMALCHFDKKVGDKDRFAFDQKSVGEITDDPIWIGEGLDQFFRVGFGEIRHLAERRLLGNDTIDATGVFSLSFMGFHFGLSFLGKPVGMLDHVTIHIDYPKGSVRSGAGHDGTTPSIFRGEEVGFAFGFGAFGGEAVAIMFERNSLNEIVEWFADEGMDGVVAEEQVVAIDHRGARTREATGVVETVEPFLWFGSSEDAGVLGAKLVAGIRRRIVRVAAEVALLNDIVPDGKAVLHTE